MTSVSAIKADLNALADSKKAAFFPSFFKTGPGQYGEGDVFLGVSVPDQRTVAKAHRDLLLSGIETLLKSPIHEHRLTALLILVSRFTRHPEERHTIVDFYLANAPRVNNWDLVDSSADKILGSWLLEEKKSIKILERLARSKNLWEQRIAMIATFAFTRAGDFGPVVTIAEILVSHEHDLMHKAVGWMLREAGKRNEKPLRAFLKKHAATMPRTMLRYAIEKFSAEERQKYLQMKSAGRRPALNQI